MKKLSWTPVQRGARGEIYCSPACGGDCTMEAYLEATRLARAAADKLGRGWMPRVWENLGWHWAVRSPCDRIEIVSNARRSFTAYLRPAGSIGGQFTATGTTPRQAIQHVVRQGKLAAKSAMALVANL